MHPKRLAYNKNTKKTPRVDGIGSHNSNDVSEEFGYPLTESISKLVHQEVASMMMTKNFQRDLAREMKRLDEPQEAARSCDAEYIRMEDLKRAVNEIISRDCIQEVLHNNAKLFSKDLLDLKTRLYTVEAKLKTLQSRMSDMEQLVHKRHNSDIEQVVRTMMKEFGEHTIAAEFPPPLPQDKRRSSEPSKSPANVLFKRWDSEELPNQVEKNILIRKSKHLNLLDRKFSEMSHKISRNAARFSASDSTLGVDAPPSIVAPNASAASLVTNRMKKQRNRSTGERNLNERYAFSNKTTHINNARALEYQPHEMLQIKDYKSKRI